MYILDKNIVVHVIQNMSQVTGVLISVNILSKEQWRLTAHISLSWYLRNRKQ